MSADIEFGELPKRPGTPGRSPAHLPIAAALKARPGEWALCFRDKALSYAGQVQAGRMVAFPKGDYEAAARKNANGKHDIWIRYVGNGGDK